MRCLSWILTVIGMLLLLAPALAGGYSCYQQRVLLQSINSSRDMPAGDEGEQEAADNGQGVSGVQESTVVAGETGPVYPPFILNIPALALKVVVVDGVGEQELRRGPGLYPQAGFPGTEGNVAIAGHRNIYGSWFINLHRLAAGDEVIITKDTRTITYQVEHVFVCEEDDWSVIAPTSYRALTLTTCDPPGNVTRRLVIRARQVADAALTDLPDSAHYGEDL